MLGGPGEDTIYFVPGRGETISLDGGTEVDKLVVDGYDPAEDIKVLAGASPDRASIAYNGRTAATDVAGVERVRLQGQGGDDTLAAPKDSTSIAFEFDGGAGNDLVSGSPNADLVTGGPGTDRLRGGSGNDVFTSFTGDAEVSGGLGDDSFEASSLAGIGETGTSIPRRRSATGSRCATTPWRDESSSPTTTRRSSTISPESKPARSSWPAATTT